MEHEVDWGDKTEKHQPPRPSPAILEARTAWTADGLAGSAPNKGIRNNDAYMATGDDIVVLLTWKILAGPQVSV